MRWIALTTLATLAVVPSAYARSVIIAPGDTLSSIAQQELGNGNLWPELCELNQPTLPNCDVLPVGATVLISPEEPQAADPEPLPEPVAGPPEEQAPAAEPAPPAEPAAAEPAAPALTSPAPTAAEEGRVNLIEELDSFAGDYWTGYYLKPDLSGGHPDPAGGNRATRFESADSGNSPQGTYSGVFRFQRMESGTYTIGAWLRTVEGTLPVRYGFSDEYLVSGEVTLNEEWQHVQATIVVDASTYRMFEVFESTKNNPAWEIYGVSVERGEFDTPFYPAP